LQGGKELLGGSREKANGKARGVISSSRLGTYLGVLSEHKGPSPVFRAWFLRLFSGAYPFFFRINRPLSHGINAGKDEHLGSAAMNR